MAIRSSSIRLLAAATQPTEESPLFPIRLVGVLLTLPVMIAMFAVR